MCRLVIRQSGKKGDWGQELWDYIIGFEADSADYTRAVVFGRSSVLERWIVVYASEFPTTRRSFQAVLHSVVHASDADAWCIVVGKVPAGGRKVVTLFSDKWMVYDRYGQFRYNQPKLLPCEPGLVPAAGAEVIEGPVPNTVYAPKGDPRLIDGDELTLLPEVVDYYKELHDKRQANAHRAQSEHGDGEFELGSSLRVTWIPAQRADKALMPMFAKGAMKEGFRIAKDGLLERLVQLPPPANATWVPIVPEGQATGNLTWKRWLFLQCHVGVLGAHRNAEKTLMMLSHQVWLPTMTEDVHQWLEKFLTSIQFMKIPIKQETVPTVPTNQDCWEVVMGDM
jgi:hypothetical protein